MSRKIHHISPAVQAQIIEEYKEKTTEGKYRYTLKQIADKHEISLSAVNNLARMAKCQGRPRGGRVQEVPSPRIMKILRDASEPFITLEEVGIRNPRIVVERGKQKKIPLTKQRVAQIINAWKGKLDESQIHSKGFKPGDKIEWSGQKYVVLRYDSPHRGAVIDLADLCVIDPFCWVFQGSRSKRIEVATEEMTQKDVEKKYLRRGTKAHSQSANGAPNRR